jgi:predicted secreted hydrolase
MRASALLPRASLWARGPGRGVGPRAQRLALRIGALLAAVLACRAPAGLCADGFAGLGQESPGFASVTPGAALAFPRDFGAHPGFRTEWWYLTANLRDASGQSYGAQWTLFRSALAPGPEREGWADPIVFMGHAAVTTASEHLFAETSARGGIGQAGVVARPFRAFIDDWSLESRDNGADAGISRLVAVASGAQFRYQLTLSADMPPVLEGDRGYSRKSEDGRASYYFSQPFYAVEGELVLRGAPIKVSGRAWMDREWSSQPLSPDQKGWDWFSLHLSSGEKLMLFRLRSASGRDFFGGNWIDADGATRQLAPEDILIEPLATTKLPVATLPTRWRVTVKSHALNIETTPLNPASWMATRFSYWEGPIRFTGSHGGEGYLEMTGY